MGFILVNGQGIAEMAGGAAQHFGIMGRIEFLGFMAGKTHLDLAGCGLVQPVGPLGQVLPDHQDQDNDEKKENKQTGRHQKEVIKGRKWIDILPDRLNMRVITNLVIPGNKRQTHGHRSSGNHTVCRVRMKMAWHCHRA